MLTAASVVLLAAAAVLADVDGPQQSTTGPTPPPAVVERDALKAMAPPAPGGVQHTIPGVPGYLWRHGCGPTAVGMVVGYYDTQGYNDLIPGDANTQTAAVDQAMASGGTSSSPNPPGSEQHYEDYARPEDSPPTLLTDDYITNGRTPHTDDSIADYMDTSKSTRNNYYGWSWSSDICPSFTGYVNQQNASYSPTCTEYRWSTGALTWAVLTNEIDNGRPMVFLVDSDGDGSTDHFVTIVGYDDGTPQKYGCLDTWAPASTIRWEQFRGMSSSYSWGIWGGWTFQLQGVQPQPVTKWVQMPDISPTGIDIRCDRNDGIQRTLADDFECNIPSLLTDVHFWGSWKNDYVGQLSKIHLSIHRDIPVDPCDANSYSMPGDLLWEKDFYPGDFNSVFYAEVPYPDCEVWWDPYTGLYNPCGDRQVYLYNIYIDPKDAFFQQGEPNNPVVYWLDIWVEIDPAFEGYEFGWKTSEEHWNDDAVYYSDTSFQWEELRYPQQHPYHPDSIDMAFVITGIPGEEPNEEEEIKYVQLPDLDYTGLDVDATLDPAGISPWGPQLLADDFPCTTTGPITDIHIWGSWYHDELPYGDPNKVTFTLSIHDDIPRDPCDPYSYSMPGNLLWVKDFYPGDFDVSIYAANLYEGWYVPCAIPPYYEPYADSICWQYDFYIDPYEAFIQQGDPCEPVVYWLDVQAQVESYDPCYPIRFGWKTSLEHWNDDAVWAIGDEYAGHSQWQELRYPQGHELYPDSIDLAFMITTGIEPNEPPYEPKDPVPHLKWSQPPIEIDVTYNSPIYCGWDQESFTFEPDMLWTVAADDFRCLGSMPVSSVHWWGSHLYWQDYEPPVTDPPIIAWQIGFWSNVPAGLPGGASGSGMTETEIAQIRQRASSATVSVPAGLQRSNTGEERPVVFNGHVLSSGGGSGGACGSILYAPTEYDDPNFRAAVSAACGGATVDYFDASAATPDVNLLLTYDCVFTWINYPCADQNQFGDNLADYVDAGGKVILGQWCYPSDQTNPLGGRILTAAYCPVTVSTGDESGSYAGDGTDCVHDGITAYDTGYLDVATLSTGNMSDGTFDPCGCLAVAWRPDRQVYYSPGNMGLYSGTGDWPELLCNMCCCSGSVMTPYSRPEELLWTIRVDANRVDIQHVGRDYFPDWPSDTCFQYYVDLEPTEYFWQDDFNTVDDVYWISIAAIYPDGMYPAYPWGWKTRPWSWMDDAVTFQLYEPFQPPVTLDPCENYIWPLEGPEGSYDLSFELDTEPNWIKWEQAYDSIRHWPHYWDELSMAIEETAGGEPNIIRLVADDWFCERPTPVSAMVWWGSYIGYEYMPCQGQPPMRPQQPDYFLLNIWADVPAGIDANYSHPNEVIWEYKAYDYDEVLVGYDKFPESAGHPISGPREPVFRYSVRLPEENWFAQKDVNGIYWLSVVAVYVGYQPEFNWGWTNHMHVFNDDAVAGIILNPGSANPEWIWQELYDQNGVSEDMSFVLFTEPECFPCDHPDYNEWVLVGKPACWCYPRQCHGDADNACQGKNCYWVSGNDLAILRSAWNKPLGGLVGNEICADFAHNAQGKGNYRVSTHDLAILRANWQISNKPDPNCLTDY